jgi:protein phosphatase 1 regulatory subunit 42
MEESIGEDSMCSRSSDEYTVDNNVLTEEEEEVLRLVFPKEEIQKSLQSNNAELKEKVLTLIEKWIKSSSALPRGFILFQSVELPIEKYKVLCSISIILQFMLKDNDNKVVAKAISVVQALAVSPAASVHKKEFSMPIFKKLIANLLQLINNPENRAKAVEASISLSKLKNFPLPLILSNLIENVDGIERNNLIGKLTLAKNIVDVHKLKYEGGEGVIDLLKVIPLITEGLKHSDEEVRRAVIDFCTTIYHQIGEKFYEQMGENNTPKMLSLRALISQEGKGSDNNSESTKKSEEEHKEELQFEEGTLSKELIERVSKKNVPFQPKRGKMRVYFEKLTHLALDECNIDRIINLHYCTNLRVLYLYRNKISKIEGLYSKYLTHIYLQHNQIEEIEGLSNLTNLQKLYLDNNCIQEVKGLKELCNLEELYISNQKLKKSQKMTFNEESMRGISKCLKILHASNNNIEELKPLSFLNSLVILNLSKNQISNFEHIQLILPSNSQLHDLDLSGNPVTKLKKYRSRIIMSSSPILTNLDKSEITSNERVFVKNLELRKNAQAKKTRQTSCHNTELNNES